MAGLEGQTIKGYELRERIGGGGFGEVYRAFQTLLKREVAIKIILPQHANQPEFIRRFEVEAELVARLEHPYIVPLFDYWRDSGGAYLVMRLLRGGSLEDLVEHGPLDAVATSRILDQVAGALTVAHRNGVVHRDLKPANILLDEDGNAYLADFGIAKDLGASAGQQTMSGMLTPNYASPEQFKGEPITLRADLYNLGLMLFELLTGRPPFSGALHEVIFKHIGEPIPSVRQFVPDLPPAIDEVLQRATAKDPEDRFPSALALAAAFKSALASANLIDTETPADLYAKTDVLGQETVIEEDTGLLENPYKGLRAFREGDADDFFGRDALIERLLTRMDETHERFLAVVGPSGSGKSSVVKAGLIPALRRGALPGSNNWFITEMYPSSQPIAELEAALLRVAINPPETLIHQLEEDERGLLRAIKRILPADDDSDLVLVIDQFEELFTQVGTEKDRLHFLNSLRAALEDPKGRLRVIVTIRADFYDRPLQYEALGELMRQQTEVVLPLSAADLQRAITGPAQRVGVKLEPGLVQAIVDAVGEQPGTLPLLQYALTELFERRNGRVLTLQAYEQIGGVTGALARRADELYRDFTPEQQETARQLFLRLVTLGEGSEDTRRRVRRTELGDDPQLDSVIGLFGQYRLLTFDRDPITRGPTVEVAHEALIRTWDRLKGWIEESREDLRIQRRLTSAAHEWLASGQNADFLASGTRLDQFEEWSKTTALTLNQEERAYLETSIAEQAARRARDEAIARRVQNLGRATAILVVMIVIAVIATGIFLNQASTAQSQADMAQTQVAQAGETLTPVQGTIAVAQAQIENVGLTLTPAQGTALAAQSAANEANAIAGTAQSQVESVGATLTPQQATVIAAQGLFENVGLTLTPVQGTVDAAQAQVENVGATLTPVQATVNAAQDDANRANVLAGTAQAQLNEVGATLTPVLATVAAAESAVSQANLLAAQAQAQVESVGATLTPQQATVVAAQALFEDVGLTLTPVQGTVVAAQLQVENVGQTLTPVQATVAFAQARLDEVGATLTPVIATVAAADAAVAQANLLAAEAQFRLNEVGATLTPAQATVAVAQAQLAEVGFTLTPQQATVVAAQAQIENVGQTLTPQQGTVAAAQVLVENVGLTLTPQQATVAAAQILVDNVGATLTPAQATVAVAQAQLEMVGQTLTPQQATIAAAQAQVENVGLTLTPQQATVIAAQLLSENVGLTLTPVQATVEMAQAQVQNVGATLTPVQATVIAAANDADSLSMAVSADQAIANGNYDLALALVLEAIRLNPNLSQAQRSLNQIAFNSPRLSFNNASVVRFSPTAPVMVIGDGAALSVWNIETRQQIDLLQGHTGPVLDVAFSPNGQYLATASQDRTAIIWDVSRWFAGGQATQLHQLAGHSAAVNAVVFNNENTFLLTGSDDTNVIRWDVRSGAQVQTYSGQPWPVKKLAYAEGGRDFFAWTDANGTRILNLWNGANGQRLFGDQNFIFDTFSPNMRNAFLGGVRGPLQIYNAANRRLEREFTRGFNWAVDTATSAAFRPFNGSEVLIGIDSSTGDNRLVLANVGTGEVVRQFQGDAARRVNGIAFNPDGTLAISGNGNQLALWDVSSGTVIRRLAAHNDLVSDIQFSADGRYALSKSRDNNVRVWDITSGDSAQLMTLRVPVNIPDRAFPHIPGFHPLRNTTYAGVWVDLFEWSLQTGQHSGTVTVGAPIKRTLYSPKEPRVVTILENVAIMWNLDAGTQGLIDRFANSNDLFSGAGAYSPNGDWLALDGRQFIYVYNTATRQRVTNITKPQLAQGTVFTSLAISPDGTRVVGTTGRPDEAEAPAGDIILWDATNGQELLRYPVEHTRTINSVSISPDGRNVLTASDDNTLILWDLESGQVLKRFAGHTDDVNIGLFSPDPANPFVLSASDDATIILWDLNSAQPLRRFQGHTQPITGLNLSPDGRQMISATRGDTIIVWRIETPQQIMEWVLANRYVKPFTADECSQYNVRNCTVQVNLPLPTPLPAQPTQADQPVDSQEATAQPEVTPTPIPAALKTFATNTGSSNVNVRSSDSTQAPIVDVLRVNERVEILGISSRGTGWYQIILPDGRLAWVSGSVISIEGNRANIPQVVPPPVNAQPTQPPSSSGGGSTGSTGGQAQPTEASAYNCSAFRLTSPIGYINSTSTTFYWDPLPGVQAEYWLSIFNEQGQPVKIVNAGSGTSTTVDTSVASIGPGFTFSYEVNVFVNGVIVCPASGNVGPRPA
jgi:WD40 repeat protein